MLTQENTELTIALALDLFTCCSSHWFSIAQAFVCSQVARRTASFRSLLATNWCPCKAFEGVQTNNSLQDVVRVVWGTFQGFWGTTALVFWQYENGHCHATAQCLVTTVLIVYCLFHSFNLFCGCLAVYSETHCPIIFSDWSLKVLEKW